MGRGRFFDVNDLMAEELPAKPEERPLPERLAERLAGEAPRAGLHSLRPYISLLRTDAIEVAKNLPTFWRADSKLLDRLLAELARLGGDEGVWEAAQRPRPVTPGDHAPKRPAAATIADGVDGRAGMAPALPAAPPRADVRHAAATKATAPAFMQTTAAAREEVDADLSQHDPVSRGKRRRALQAELELATQDFRRAGRDTPERHVLAQRIDALRDELAALGGGR